MEHDAITEKIIGCAFAVHKALGAGFLEKVYERALALELKEAELAVLQQAPITVYHRGESVGEYFADLLVNNTIICEIKAASQLAPEHEIQLVNYLTATGREIGLLINFGKSVTVKRKFRTPRPNTNPVNPNNPVNPV